MSWAIFFVTPSLLPTCEYASQVSFSSPPPFSSSAAPLLSPPASWLLLPQRPGPQLPPTSPRNASSRKRPTKNAASRRPWTAARAPDSWPGLLTAGGRIRPHGAPLSVREVPERTSDNQYPSNALDTLDCLHVELLPNLHKPGVAHLNSSKRPPPSCRRKRNDAP